MPTPETLPAAAEEWSRQGALYVEPRLTRLGVAHGLTTRGLGPMAGPDRRCAAAREAGIGDDAPLTLKQVHGKTLYDAALDKAGREGDGWLIGRGFLAGIFVADCVPLLIWDRSLTKIAVVHAGWRGIAAGIVEEALSRFSGPVAASAGPHIGVCCYEVGAELQDEFPAELFQGSRLDLGAAVRSRLEAAGAAPGAVGVSALCTRCGENDFFSYRRDRARENMMLFAGLR